MEYAIPLDPGLEVAGVFVGALSGGVAAVRKEFDVFGVFVLAWVAGLGGGIVRDLLIGAIPPVGISDWRFVTAAAVAALVTYFFHARLDRFPRAIAVLDAGALALFTVVGTLKALAFGVGALAAVFAGVLTGVGGGMARDVLSDRVPQVLQDRQLYAVPAILGSVLMVLAWDSGRTGAGWVLGLVGFILALRLLALRFHLTAPGPWQSSGWGRMDR